MSNATVKGNIIIKGEFVLDSPLIIGSGEKENKTDIVVLKDENGKPYISATSFVGALKHWFDEEIVYADNKEQENFFWGADKKNTTNTSIQSAFIIDDLYMKSSLSKTPISYRDGVRIDNRTGIAKKGAKYSFEIVNAYTKFDFYARVIIREAFNKDTFKKILSTILTGLKTNKIHFGAMTNKGFGRGHLENVKIMDYDFSSKMDVYKWLAKKDKEPTPTDALPEHYEEKASYFELNALFSLKNSLIVHSYSMQIGEPDAVHIRWIGKNRKEVPIPILPGTSTKGVLRNRMMKIIKTIIPSIDEKNEEIKKFLGYVGEKGKEKTYKSELSIEETKIDNVLWAEQTRIKVDRFTQGTIKGALFNNEPIWKNLNSMVKIKAKIKNFNEQSKWKAGLLLLAVKDLWNEDLAIGGEKGTGKGILKGIEMHVRFNDKKIDIQNDNGHLKINGDKDVLEECVKDLSNKFQEGGNDE